MPRFSTSLFPSVFPTKILYALLFSPECTTLTAHLIHFDLSPTQYLVRHTRDDSNSKTKMKALKTFRTMQRYTSRSNEERSNHLHMWHNTYYRNRDVCHQE